MRKLHKIIEDSGLSSQVKLTSAGECAAILTEGGHMKCEYNLMVEGRLKKELDSVKEKLVADLKEAAGIIEL